MCGVLGRRRGSVGETWFHPRDGATGMDTGRGGRVSEHPDVLRPGEMEWIDRGAGVRSVPLVGKWNTESAELTTGITAFVPGTELPLHTHNVDETVLILEGEALVTIADERSQLGAQDV